MTTKRIKDLKAGDKVQLTGGNGCVVSVAHHDAQLFGRQGGAYRVTFSLLRDGRKSLDLLYAGNERVRLEA